MERQNMVRGDIREGAVEPTRELALPKDLLAGTLAITLGYRGEGFAGYAEQPGQRTVAGELRQALQTLLRRDVDMECAGRTDAGVSALGQVVSVPVTAEQKKLTGIAKDIYAKYGCDGKYILDGKRLILCQSNAPTEELRAAYPKAEINPLGDWTGGPDVDTGATNRKLGSDMADSVTGGGLHGKDLSKADVSVNIWAWLKAQETGKPVEVCCAIGDDHVGGVPFSEMVETARGYIMNIGGFERFAEWGLVR